MADLSDSVGNLLFGPSCCPLVGTLHTIGVMPDQKLIPRGRSSGFPSNNPSFLTLPLPVMDGHQMHAL